MLPFSKKDDNLRKYVCFSCGMSFKLYSEMQSHLKEKHDEGREYITCPKCKAAVRELKYHYQASHRGEKPPANVQQKAMIWRDFGNRRRKTKKPHFKEGHLISLKNEGRAMHYRSGWELEVYECLEELKEVLRYDVESFYVPYYWKGEWHKYYPDLTVYFTDGHIEIWEVKPQNQQEIEKNQAKWKACYNLCENKGYRFVVQSEKEINQLRRRVLNESRERS